MSQMSLVLQQQIKELEAVLGSGRIHCVRDKEVDLNGCSWHELCTGPEGAGPDPAMLRSQVRGWLFIHHIISLLGSHQGGFGLSPCCLPPSSDLVFAYHVVWACGYQSP